MNSPPTPPPKKVSGFVQRRLDYYYFFISNTLQDLVRKTDVFAPFSTDHSPVSFSFGKGNDYVRGKGLWKFYKSLISNSKYIESTKKHICET